MDYTDLARVKAPMGALEETDDTLIGDLITAASRFVDRFCAGSFQGSDDYFLAEDVVDETHTCLVDESGRMVLWPHKPLINSVSSISYRTSPLSTWSEIDDDYISLDGAQVVVWYSFTDRTPVQVKISYNGGLGETLAELPDDLVKAVTGLAIRWYNEEKSGLNDVIGVSELGNVFYSKSIPQRIQQMMNQYRRIVPW